MKGSAGSLVTLVSWLGSWIVSYAFNFLMDWNSAGNATKFSLPNSVWTGMRETLSHISSYFPLPGTFFMFSCISGVTILFVAKLVPETKGRTLEEIQTSMNQFSEKR